MIIFDEKKYAENILSNAHKTFFIKQRNLNILTKYYCYLGLNKQETRRKLIEYATMVDTTFNEIIGDNILDFALRHFGKSKLRVGEPITIYNTEVEKIHEIGDIRGQRVVFIMLVVAKNFNKSKSGDYYYNGSLSDLFRLSRLTGLSKAERIDVVHNLSKLGYIEPNLRGGYKISLADKDGVDSDDNIVINDFSNIMDMFPAICSICGKQILGMPKRRTYCDDCYNNKRKNDVRKNVRKLRNKPKEAM